MIPSIVRRPTMPDERRTLRLVRGGVVDTAGRPTRRRRAVRRTPEPPDPIEELLAHLDEEPSVATPRRSVHHRSTTTKRRTVSRPAPKPKPRRSYRPSRTTVILTVVLCAAIAVAVLSGTRWYADRGLDRAHQQAIAAAKQTTVNFVSVSASSVDRDLQRIVAGATGDFKDEFTRGQAQVRAAVVENNVQSQGSVLRAALVSGDRRTAVVLVAIDATVKNTKTPAGRASHYRIQVDVARDPGTGRWLVSRLQFVG
jgi:Mce-associated membrane protein